MSTKKSTMKEKLENMQLRERINYGYKMVIIMMLVSGLLSVVVIGVLFSDMMHYVNKVNAADQAVKVCRINVSAAARNIREMALNPDTFAKTRKEIQRLTEMGAHVIPIFSYQTQNCDTRFGTAKEFMEEVCDITGNPGIRTLQEAEPIGPKGYLDVMVIAPCTGNSAAKLANAITDTPVLMAAKAHMRNGKPLVIAISTNDALGASFKNIGMLMNTKHIYFVPFAQDNYEKKPNSMVAKMELLPETISAALEGKQLQPVVRG